MKLKTRLAVAFLTITIVPILLFYVAVVGLSSYQTQSFRKEYGLTEQVDLFSGEGQLFKLGAAPSYVKKGSAVQRLSGTSLPAGLAEGEQGALDQFTLKLVPGDTVLMVSDGICGAGEDQWVKDKLAQFDGASPKDLARELITDSPKEVTDARTALVIRIEKRAAGQMKSSLK